MNLNNISTGTWNKISNYLNYNFSKLSVAISRLQGISLVTFKGVYSSRTELINSQATPVPGDYAFVIISSDSAFKVYYVDSSNGWVTDNGTYNPEVILKDYIEMTALTDVLNDLAEDIDDYNNRHRE